jgi:two-component system chemotaxis response regulator CheB
MIIDLIVIGGSAGSLQVVMEIIPQLRPDLQVPVLVVFHRKATPNPELLIRLLDAKTRLTIKEAEDKETLKGGIIYVAPADYHLLVEKDGSLSLDISEKINYSRPSIDLTFMTAADAYQERTMAVILSGANADGMRGMEIIHRQGGFCVAQDPLTAQVAFMPSKAIAKEVVHQIASPDEIAAIMNLCQPSSLS